ncbi:MAG: hypothetical protein U9N85_00470 [Bacteroidota bacterium]|nr:hypothetical protein [Bacteroidota bacterium]
MNKKTVYDELLNYKVKPDDSKLITELFIKAQKNEMNISLKELMMFYGKKINFRKFKKLIEFAIENSVELPINELTEISLTGDDFLNLLSGMINARSEKLEIKTADFVHFAKAKINISELLTALKIINEYDETIVLNDFVNCTNCLYQTSEFVKQLVRLKKTDPNISLKSVIELRFEKNEVSNILKKYSTLTNYSQSFSLSDIIELKTYRIDTIDFIDGLLDAEKQNIAPNKKLLTDLAVKNHGLKHVIAMSYTPEKIEVKPVKIILKSSLELYLKITFNLFTKVETFMTGFGKEETINRLKRTIASHSNKYSSAKDFLSHAEELTTNAENEINKLNSAYRISQLLIRDFVIGRDINTEQDIRILDGKRRREEAIRALKREKEKNKTKYKAGAHKEHKKHGNEDVNHH